jgi:hypothetical protein
LSEQTPNKKGYWEVPCSGHVWGPQIDWLTATVNGEAAEHLLAASRAGEAGYGVRGFGRSEVRTGMGFTVWRRWEPRQASRKLGREYESWEGSGYHGGELAELLRGRRGCRPTRVDVAFDQEVADDVTPETWAERAAPVAARAGITMGVSGQADVNTRYVGAASSDLRIRCYRKDREDGLIAFHHGAVLRVELVMRRDRAAAWWRVYDRSEAAGFAAAAAHVYKMSGCRVQEIGEIPVLEQRDEVDASQRLLTFAEQHASMVLAAAECGYDLEAICRGVRDRWCSRTVQRFEELREVLGQVDPDDVMATIDRLVRMRAMLS